MVSIEKFISDVKIEIRRIKTFSEDCEIDKLSKNYSVDIYRVLYGSSTNKRAIDINKKTYANTIYAHYKNKPLSIGKCKIKPGIEMTALELYLFYVTEVDRFKIYNNISESRPSDHLNIERMFFLFTKKSHIIKTSFKNSSKIY